jgi:hypothetical protein
MKKFLDLLNKREQRIVGLLFLLLLGSLVFYIFVARAEKAQFYSHQRTLSTVEKNYKQRELNKAEKEEEWKKWKQTLVDMKQLRENFFYREEDAILQMRKDLQKIFRDTGVPVPAINYDYEDSNAESIKKIRVKFEIKGPYFSLKKFIHALEGLQKFLVIERIDFVNTETQAGGFRLSMSLAGYYEEKV